MLRRCSFSSKVNLLTSTYLDIKKDTREANLLGLIKVHSEIELLTQESKFVGRLFNPL